MSVQRGPRSTWIGRLIRGRRFDRNPLRRATDRAETVLMVALFAFFLCGGWFAAHSAAAWSTSDSMRELRAQQAAYHHVRATVAGAPVAAQAYGAFSLAPQVQALARWTAPDGAARTGLVVTPATAHKGSTVPIWTDRAGHLVTPLSPARIAMRSDLAAAVAIFAAAILTLYCAVAVRHALNRRRLAAWDADWLATGPRWTSRR